MVTSMEEAVRTCRAETERAARDEMDRLQALRFVAGCLKEASLLLPLPDAEVLQQRDDARRSRVLRAGSAG